mmetsp:Transcript_64443/g.135211  ORF Transcript_64443/g.135211 Transcript_64443/m.135211 type:complete len:91 (+) Transcript_64443:396-668(+)
MRRRWDATSLHPMDWGRYGGTGKWMKAPSFVPDPSKRHPDEARTWHTNRRYPLATYQRGSPFPAASAVSHQQLLLCSSMNIQQLFIDGGA